MVSKIKSFIERNSIEFENQPLIKPSGFREYDARWWFGSHEDEKDAEINLPGIQLLGKSLGTLINEEDIDPKIIVGHDFRHYSLSIKQALTIGLMQAGIEVFDIGLSLSPMAYFSQFKLGISAVAMVTASHNTNGWTGIKMGINPPLTFGPEEMLRLKNICLENKAVSRKGGKYEFVDGLKKLYIEDLVDGIKLKNKLKVVLACGNGTAGAFAKEIITSIGADVVELDCELNNRFPSYNPNPEDMKMLRKMSDACIYHNADICMGFDGDGDRCGVVDDKGEEIFADKMGVLIARDLSNKFSNAKFVVDVKSTGLFSSDPILKKNGSTSDYYKTGHSYIKKRCHDLNALAGFEKSGHYFFNKPIGRGYDCGFNSAIAILQMLDNSSGVKLSQLRSSLPKTWGSPTMSPFCSDENKYFVVGKIIDFIKDLYRSESKIIGMNIKELNTINGIRFTLDDGTWCLVRASSNSPNLVIVVESPTSEENKNKIFEYIEGIISTYPEIGAFDQKL
jgi:phosphomannomutase / phosphoglucomutase